MKRLVAISIAATALIIGACADVQPEIKDAWVRASPDGKALGVAYFTLRNSGHETTLVAVRSDAHADASIHISENNNGIVRMRAKGQVAVPEDSVVEFEPGGMHVMLLGPTRTLIVGNIVQLSLEFSDGLIITADAIVRSSPP